MADRDVDVRHALDTDLTLSGPRRQERARMPSDLRIIDAREFLQATPNGQLDLDRTKNVLLEIALASAPSNDYDIILDTRNAQSDLDVSDLWELAAELHRYRKAFSRKTDAGRGSFRPCRCCRT